MGKPLRVMIVGDSEDDALLVVRALRKGGYDTTYDRVETAEAMRASLRQKHWDVILCDYKLPRFSGRGALKLYQETKLDIPFIIVSGAIGEETAVEAMKVGAHDYIMKDNLSRLVPAIERELKEAETRSQRKRAEEIIRNSEEKFRKAFHSSPILTAISTMEEGRFLDVNEIFLKTLLFSREEVIGKTSLELGLFADPARRQTIRKITEEQGYAKNIETQMVATNGRVIDGLFSAEPIAIDNEKCWLTVMINVTEQRRIEEAQRQSDENFRRSLDDSPLGVRIVTIEGETIYANRAILDIYGFDSIEELKTTPAEKRYTPESFAEYQIRREKRKQGDDVTSEYYISIERKDGEVRQLHVFRKEILWDAERQFQVLYNDITERKRAEDKLRESEKKFSAAFHRGPQMMAISDIETGRYLEVNDNFSRVTGFSKEETFGKTSVELGILTQEDRQEIVRELQSTGSLSGKELRMFRKNQEPIHCLFFGEIIPVFGKNRLLSLVEDITERKRAEAALRESEERYRTVARLSSEFAYSCIHAGDDGYEVDWITDAFFTLTGYSEAELHEQRCWLFVSHADDREMATKPLHELKAGESDTREFRIVTKGGRVLYIISHMECQVDPKAPGGLRLFGAVQDITERKRMEGEKRRLEERSHKLVDDVFRFLPEGILVFSHKMEVLRQNQAFRELVSGYARRLGFAEDELENLIVDKIKAAMGDENIKEIRISRKHETGEQT
jgi:PAS domain S-box-containing protein